LDQARVGVIIGPGCENNGTNGTNQLPQQLRAELPSGTGPEPGGTDLDLDQWEFRSVPSLVPMQVIDIRE